MARRRAAVKKFVAESVARPKSRGRSSRHGPSLYGRVPLLFYVAHLFVAHALAVTLALMQGGQMRRIPVVNHPELLPQWCGLSLPASTWRGPEPKGRSAKRLTEGYGNGSALAFYGGTV
jgi:hypothetical protein